MLYSTQSAGILRGAILAGGTRESVLMNATDTMAGQSSETGESTSEDPGGGSPADEPGESPPPQPPSQAQVDVLDATCRVERRVIDWLTKRTSVAIQRMQTSGEVRIRLIDDNEMARCHQAHCDVPGTTDVITFDMSDGRDVLDVDLLICVDEARRQSDLRGHPLEQELLLYAVHGMLHCLGYDDHDESDAAAMHQREDDILTGIGVGVTYASRGAES